MTLVMIQQHSFMLTDVRRADNIIPEAGNALELKIYAISSDTH